MLLAVTVIYIDFILILCHYKHEVFFSIQVKRLKDQLEQKKQKNGTEDASSPEGDVLENGADSNIMDIQSKKLPALSQLQSKSFRNYPSAHNIHYIF